MMRRRFVASGVLIGIVLGVIISFVFPNLLSEGLKFNLMFNQGIGNPNNLPSATSGSVFNSMMIMPILFGITGGVIGFLLFKIKQLLH